MTTGPCRAASSPHPRAGAAEVECVVDEPGDFVPGLLRRFPGFGPVAEGVVVAGEFLEVVIYFIDDVLVRIFYIIHGYRK